MAEPEPRRRLAAVLAADVVGYSRLMGKDEAGTHARLKALRKDLVEPRIAAHHGNIVKLTGDGALVEFASVVDAVACAADVQRAIAANDRGGSDDQRLAFRIGINLGDVIFDDGDIYGDGVNVAARLEGLAEPGGICVSRTVYNHVKDKVDLAFEPMGEHRVKNIAEPVTVYRVLLDADPAAVLAQKAKRATRAVRRRGPLVAAALALLVLAGGAAWQGGMPRLIGMQGQSGPAEAALPLPDKPSIAVLPFDNLSGEERFERLADGITEDIITDLSRFRELFVIARNSTFVYKDQPTDVRQISRELGVQYVLEGSLQASEERVRITAQLIDATTGNHVWSERYDRPVDDVFAIQDEVTQTIAGQLSGFHGAVARSRRETAKRKAPKNVDAYELYLLGVESKHKSTKEANKRAQELLQEAIVLDPNLARAYVALGLSYNLEVDHAWNEGYESAMTKWFRAIKKAIELDPYDSEAHVVMALYNQYVNEFDRALIELEKAFELNPNSADGLAIATWILTRAGRPEQAVDGIERAFRLNPHHPDWYWGALRDAYFHARRFEDAIRTINKRPTSGGKWDSIFGALAHAQIGHKEEAARNAARLLADYPDWSAEKWLNDTGAYARDTEMELFLGSVEKADLPVCATPEQLEKYPNMKRLERCEAARAQS